MKLKSKIIVFSAMLLSWSTVANATKYTAVASGSYNNGSTWKEGIAPPFTFADTLDIPAGITVTSNNDITLLKNASFTINGTLDAPAQKLDGSAVQVYGTGTLRVDSTGIAGTKLGTFKGTVYTNIFSVDFGEYINDLKTTHVYKRLYVAGTIGIGQWEHLYVYDDVEIVMVGNNLQTHRGNIDINEGTLHLPRRYNVKYIGGNITTGVEIYGAGLNNVEINPGRYHTVTLSADLVNFKKLILASGKLLVNEYMVMFRQNADLAPTGRGELDYTKNGKLAIYAKNGLSGKIRFAPGQNWISELTMDAPMILDLPANFNIGGTLNLQNGKINIHNEVLRLNADLYGGNKNSYIIVEEGGKIISTMYQTKKWFPIGTYNHYAPCHVYMDYPSQKSFVTSVGLVPGVFEYTTTGYNMAWHHPVVNATWFVEMDPDARLTVQWDSAMEVNAFDKNTAYIAEFEYGKGWVNTNNNKPATYAGNENYRCEQKYGTKNKWFAVFSGNTAVGIDAAETSPAIKIHPNPASDVVHINILVKTGITILNSVGSIVFEGTIDKNHNTINIASLPRGYYTVRLNDGTSIHTSKFIKL